jgi:hypothetical protein
MVKIRSALPGAFHIGMSVDARQAHYNAIHPLAWYPFVNSVHPQVYWPDMGVSPQDALSYAYQAWGNYGRPIFPALSGYGTDPSLIMLAHTLAVNTYKATGLSWWAFGHIDAAHFSAIDYTVGGMQMPSAPGTGSSPAQPGMPILVTVGSPNYHDGAYDSSQPGFQTYVSANGGTGKYMPANDHVATVWAAYDPQIRQAGWYKIEAFIPNQHATTGNARYKIHGVKEHPGEWLVSAAQSSGSNSWMNLGTFEIEPSQQQPGVIYLDDWTFEIGREIAWDAIRWTPMVGAARVLIAVPYRTQEGPDARRYRNDCGPACVAMLLDWQHKVKGLPPVQITIDQLSSETPLASHDTGLTSQQLVRLAAAHGLTLQLHNDATLPNILAEVAAGRPVLSLIAYAPLLDRENKADTGGHFLVVTGYDGSSVYVNDPDWWNDGKYTAAQGNNWRVPLTQFTLAVSSSPVPNQSCFVAL